jgi:hypothetical protein
MVAPSTWRAAPLTNRAGSEHRKHTTLPKSAGSPTGPSPSIPACLARSVSWVPGQARLRVMLSSNRSAAAVLAHAHRPVLAVLDRARVGIGSLTALEVIRQMRPQPAARMGGSAAWTSRIEVSRLAWRAASSASSSTSRARAGGGPPALATSTSSPPKRSTAAATSRPGAAGSVTSAATARASPGMAAAASASAASPRAHSTTLAPSWLRARALARPSPLDDAVTSATFPFRPRSIGSLPRRRGRTARRPFNRVGAVWVRCRAPGPGLR